MNIEDIIRMARKAKDGGSDDPDTEAIDWVIFTPFELERFAAIVASAEREACVKACEYVITNDWEGAVDCANAIRARGQA